VRAGSRPPSLQHALQRLDLVASFGELLRQALVRLLQGEDYVFQQDDPLGQLALATADWRAETVGDDLAAGPLVCHQSISGRLRATPAGTSRQCQLNLYQIFSDMVMCSSGDARAVPSVSPPAIVSDVGIEGRPSGRHSSWR
jgi:hypothetical protein